MTYNIILLGPPATGKGTQAERLAVKLNVPHISTGDMFRQLAAENDPLGVEARDKYWNKGNLVPDDITIELVRKRLAKDDCKDGFIFDGFPRTIPQAEALEKMLAEEGKKVDFVIEIKTSDEVIIARVLARLVCTKCKKIYGLDVPPKVEGVCDVDGALLVHRNDDTEEVMRDRLEIYNNQTAPLVKFYKERNLLHSVDGEQKIDKIQEDLMELVKPKA